MTLLLVRMLRLEPLELPDVLQKVAYRPTGLFGELKQGNRQGTTKLGLMLMQQWRRVQTKLKAGSGYIDPLPFSSLLFPSPPSP